MNEIGGNIGPGAVAGSGSVEAGNLAGRDVEHHVQSVTFNSSQERDDWLYTQITGLARESAATREAVEHLETKFGELRRCVEALENQQGNQRVAHAAGAVHSTEFEARVNGDMDLLRESVEQCREALFGNGQMGLRAQWRVGRVMIGLLVIAFIVTFVVNAVFYAAMFMQLSALGG